MKTNFNGRQRLAMTQAINSKVIKTPQDIQDCTIMLNLRDQVQLSPEESAKLTITLGCPRCGTPLETQKGINLETLAQSEYSIDVEVESSAALIVRARMEEWQKEGNNVRGEDVRWYAGLLEELRAK